MSGSQALPFPEPSRRHRAHRHSHDRRRNVRVLTVHAHPRRTHTRRGHGAGRDRPGTPGRRRHTASDHAAQAHTVDIRRRVQADTDRAVRGAQGLEHPIHAVGGRAGRTPVRPSGRRAQGHWQLQAHNPREPQPKPLPARPPRRDPEPRWRRRTQPNRLLGANRPTRAQTGPLPAHCPGRRRRSQRGNAADDQVQRGQAAREELGARGSIRTLERTSTGIAASRWRESAPLREER